MVATILGSAPASVSTNPAFAASMSSPLCKEGRKTADKLFEDENESSAANLIVLPHHSARNFSRRITPVVEE